jgi:short-subunit dehydrogenase
MNKTFWIVGGSSGIGYELATLYLKNNYQVIVSARKAIQTSSLQELLEKFPGTLRLVDVDVSDMKSVTEATKTAWQCFGKIDLCFYNAGVYEHMKVENWDIVKFEQMAQINYLGAVRITTALTPFFQKNDNGNFVFNASISSYFGLPYGGGYSAPKAALLNFCESIEPELKEKNIQVRVINHGFVKTRLTAKNDFDMPGLLEPYEAAKIIFDRLHNSQGFEIKFPFTLSSFLYFLRIVPYRLALYLTKKVL